MIKEYILQNWILILVLTAFIIMLKVSVFKKNRTINRMYILIAIVFLLSVSVFVEFYLDELGTYKDIRTVLMAIRYSATPIIIAMIIFTLVKKAKWYIFIPAILSTIINVISIFTGIVFSIKDTNTLIRGPLGYLPFIIVGLYSVFLLFILFEQSNKIITEIIPIIFLSFAFLSGLVLPFVLGKEYSKIFCTTIAVALFVYYDFSILQLSKKDPLTGLFNRQAYETAIVDSKDITAVVSIDMNGLKAINDLEGHIAGDEALITIAICFAKATKTKQLAYRIGGDEFIIICKKSTLDDVKHLVQRVQKNVSGTKYNCAIGYSYCLDSTKSIEEMIKESDEMMYKDKEEFYSKPGNNRYRG